MRRVTTGVSALGVLTLALGLAVTGPAGAAEEGRNVALDRPVTSSGTEVADGRWTADRVTDGDDGARGTADNRDPDASRWSSNPADDAWVAVELAEPTVVDHVAIQWANACAAAYHLEVSVDGQEWVDATESITPVCGSRDVQELSVDTPVSFVKMQAEDRVPIGGVKYGVSLWELEVWDGPEPVEPAPEAVTAAVLPEPASMEVDEDAEPFVLTPGTAIVAPGDAAATGAQLAELLAPATGFDLAVQDAADGPAITLELSDGDIPAEGYELTADAEGVLIEASTEAGLFYGAHTLRQLLGGWADSAVTTNGPWLVPDVEISDAPRFEYRGHMIDPSRSFFTVEEVEQILDRMSSYKLNKLHIHLTDDQGWRIAISNEDRAEGDDIDYTQLTEISGQTAVASTQFQPLDGVTGYYTQDDFRHIVEYAAERHVEIIPEIDAPAHINAALHAIDQLNSEGSYPAVDPETGRTPVNTTTSVGESSLDAENPYTYLFMSHVVSQIAAMNPDGDYFHLGGDESFNTTGQAYDTFMHTVLPDIAERGLRPVVWTEGARADLPEGSVVQYWTGGNEDRIRDHVANNGGQVIMSHASQAYLPQVPGPEIQGPAWACGGPCGLDRFYNWDPATSGPGVGEDGVLGVEAPLWNEHVRGVADAEFMTYPRLIATAEVGWTPQELRSGDAAEFFERMAAHGTSLTASGTNFHLAPQVQWLSDVAGVDLELEDGEALDGAVIGYLSAPGTEADDVSVTVEWSDGAEGTVETVLTREPEYKVNTGIYEITASRDFAERGTYTATITTTAPDGERSETLDVVVAAAAPEPTDPPVEPTDPPVEPTDPPAEPTDPPAGPSDPGATPADPSDDDAGQAPGGQDGTGGGDDGAGPAPSSGSLPSTGAELAWPALAALLLAGAGVALTVRRRATAQ